MVKNFCNLTFWLQKGTYDMDGPVPGDQLVKTNRQRRLLVLYAETCKNIHVNLSLQFGSY
jgi:hypothetical protein